MRKSGSCLCGAVAFEADVPEPTAQACHCVQCQRWTGGGPLFVLGVQNVDMRGQEAFSAYRASAHGERVNCGTCGSPLFWRMQGEAPRSLALGLFDDQSDIQIGAEIFVDRRAGWLPVFDGASQSTETQELGKLEAYLESKSEA